jgi:hypothetical protein
MGPLSVNELISANTNLFLAFIIGIGFGFVLEQSGFLIKQETGWCILWL